MVIELIRLDHANATNRQEPILQFGDEAFHVLPGP